MWYNKLIFSILIILTFAGCYIPRQPIIPEWDFTLINQLQAAVGTDKGYFGFSVALSADGYTALCGAYGDNGNGSNTGAAYINRWNHSTWIWEQKKLTASDSAANDYFGYRVALSANGNMALIGACTDDNENGTDAGAVYVFKYHPDFGWKESKLIASDGAEYDYFGISISLSADGKTALIGATGDDDNDSSTGSAYIFKWDNLTSRWIETKLLAPDGRAMDRFGTSVALSEYGTTALIGADLNNSHGTDAGSAYLFSWIPGFGWGIKKLLASDGIAYSYFGGSVALSADGKTVLIGAKGTDEHGDVTGSAYIYRCDSTDENWKEYKLTDVTGGDVDDAFGYAVALSADGKQALITAITDDNDNGLDAGSVYFFKWDSSAGKWLKIKKLIAAGGAAGDFFGQSVAMAAYWERALIGAHGVNLGANADAGSAYLYRYDKDNSAGMCKCF